MLSLMQELIQQVFRGRAIRVDLLCHGRDLLHLHGPLLFQQHQEA